MNSKVVKTTLPITAAYWPGEPLPLGLLNAQIPIRGERWRLIPSHPAYQASTLGRIRRRSTGHIVAQRAHHRDAYLQARLHAVDGKRRTIFTHVLVAEAFLDRRPDRMDVDHRHGLKHDNRPSQLRYLSRAKNLASYWQKRRWIDGWKASASSLESLTT